MVINKLKMIHRGLIITGGLCSIGAAITDSKIRELTVVGEVAKNIGKATKEVVKTV